MSELTIESVRTRQEIDELYAKGYWGSEFLTDVLDRGANEHPDRTFIYEGARRISWLETQQMSIAFATALRDRGINAGDRVAVQLPNWSEFIVAYFAIARIGAVMVPIMSIYRAHEVAHVLQHSGARAYVSPAEFRDFDYRAMLDSIRDTLPDLELRIVVRSTTPSSPGELSFEELLNVGREARCSSADFAKVSPDLPHLIVFTSGTESRAKGCVHTWNTFSYTPRNLVPWYSFDATDIDLVVSPMAHSTGLAAGVVKVLFGGGGLCLMEAFAPDPALELIDTVGCTQMTAATPFLTMMVASAKQRPGAGSNLRVFSCGGAPVPAAVIEEAYATFPNCRIVTAYGQSEVLMVTLGKVTDSPEKTASSDGGPFGVTEVRIVDGDGNELPIGAEGEIVYRGPGQILGYWKNPEATAASILPGGWRRSGDLGRMDSDNYLRVTGRVKDIIIRGGMNISAREVEELLVAHPAVSAAAVVGIPDERLGERVGAAVVLKAGENVDVATLLAYLKNDCGVANQKLPEKMVTLSALPMNATGKVLKFEVVKLLVD